MIRYNTPRWASLVKCGIATLFLLLLPMSVKAQTSSNPSEYKNQSLIKKGVSFSTAYEAILYDLQSEVWALKKRRQRLFDDGHAATSLDIKALEKAIARAQSNVRVHQIEKEIADLKMQMQNIVDEKERSNFGPGSPVIITMTRETKSLKQRIVVLQKEKGGLENVSKFAQK
jgi:hypothetical protein